MDVATAVDVTLIDNRPIKVETNVKGPIYINGQPVGALLMGRSSMGVMSNTHWPEHWPLTPAVGEVESVGGAQAVMQSSHKLVVKRYH